MARPRTFEETNVLADAMETFWSNGYEATSIDDLVASTGLSRSSLYQAFGSKRGLFDAAVDHYQRTRVDSMLSELEGTDAGLGAITGFFDKLAGVAEQHPERATLGCMLTNSMGELGNTDAAFPDVAFGYVDRLSGAFANALANAAERGEIDDDQTDERANVLATLALGSFVRLRGTHSGVGTRELSEAVGRMLDDWRL